MINYVVVFKDENSTWECTSSKSFKDCVSLAWRYQEIYKTQAYVVNVNTIAKMAEMIAEEKKNREN